MLYAILLTVFMVGCADHEAAERQARYNAWYQSLTPAQQEREDQRQHERSIAAMQALGMMNMGRGIFPAYTPPPPVRSYPEPTFQQRQRLNCTTNYIGQQAMTHCD